MHPIPVLGLVVLLAAAAGCTAALEEPSEAEEPAATTPYEPLAPAAEDPKPSPTPPPSEEPPAEPSGGAPPAPEPNDTATQPPPPPQPQPWQLVEKVAVGWAAGAGAGGKAEAPSQGTSDAAYCADATFALPAGATLLRVQVAAEPARPTPSAGQYVLYVTSPDGTTTAMDPATANVPSEAGGGGPGASHAFEAPVPGAWRIRAEPLGPAVQHAWDVTLTAEGASVELPATMGATTTCG